MSAPAPNAPGTTGEAEAIELATRERRTQRRRSRRRALAMILLVVVLSAGGGAAWWTLYGSTHVSTENAYVGGNVVQVTPQVAGTVIELRADDTQLVRAGDMLVRLDATDYEVQLASAEAALADAVRSSRGLYANTGQARAALTGREAEVRRARFELAAAQAGVDKAQSELARRETLAARNFVSPENVQSARTALEAALAQRDAARAAIAQAESAITAAGEQLRAADGLIERIPVEQQPRVLAAAARLREAHLALGRTRILAPVTGYVARRSVQVGQRVSPGAALMAIIPADQLWVDANFREAQLQHVRIGQPATIQADLYGSAVTYSGTVVGLSMGTGSAFALLPAQNATGNWIKIVQRVPVRVALDPAELAAHPLRIGLSMHVTIDTADRSGEVLAQDTAQGGGYRTSVFSEQSGAADALIEAIIVRNLDTRRK